MKRLVILGSTGSIGRQTLEVVRRHPDAFRVVGLGAGRNAEALLQQVREFRPGFVSLSSMPERAEVSRRLEDTGRHLVTAEEMVTHSEADLVVVATVGSAGLTPTLAALRAGHDVALANKEVLVMAGHLVVAEAQRTGSQLLPVDSEHSALWQCLHGEEKADVERIVLTASGGAFRDRPLELLPSVTPAEALAHPTWQMGPKVTVDSATLANKGMEAIEARWLFDVPMERISVVMHRESIIHSLVEFRDGSCKAQLSLPDMRLPIQYALTYPERWPVAGVGSLDLAHLGTLNFAEPDMERYPCLRLALEAGRRGSTYPAVLAAADEVAVDAFLGGVVSYPDIPRLVESTLEAHQAVSAEPSLEEVMAADGWAREYALSLSA